MRSIPWRLWALAILSSLLQVLAFPIAGPAPLWRRIFCWFCLTPLLFAMLGNSTKGTPLRASQTAWLGYVCGIFWYLGNCYWIYQTMHLYGELPKAASMGILLLFSMYVALYHALFGALIGWLRKRASLQVVLVAAPFLWVAVELARARVTGFPWDLLGYTQIDNLLLTRLAPLTGVFGISFVVAAINSLWLVKFRKITASGAVVAAVLVLGFVLLRNYPHPPTNTSAKYTAVLVQENLSIGAEAVGASETKQQMLNSFSQLSMHPTFPSAATPATQQPEMIAWPEAPAPFFDADQEFHAAITALSVQMKTPVIVNDIGIGARTPEGHYEEFNSASFFLPNGTYAGHYDKMRLVPFGEYVPYKSLFFFAGDLLGNLPFVPGQQRKLFSWNGRRYGTFICYESIFGDDIRHFAGDGAEVLVNISDDGWYGDSSAPWEHLDMVRMRAIESHRWILRATNTGVTVAIDPYGRITQSMPRHIRGSMVANFDYNHDLTFYVKFGDWFGWLCVLASLVFFGLGYMPKKAVN